MFLGVVTDGHARADLDFTRIGSFLSQQHADKDRFPRTVWTDQPYPLAVPDGLIQVSKNLFIPK